MWLLLPPPALAADPLVDAFVACAVAHDPAVVQADSAVVIARGAATEARGLFENPEVQAGAAVVGGLVQGSVVQPISLSGAGRYTRRETQAALVASTADAERAALVASADARSLLVATAVAHASLRLSDLDLDGAARVRAAVERRLAAGEATELEAHLARLAEAEAVSRALTDRAEGSAVRRAVEIACPSWTDALLEVDEAVPMATGPAVDRLDLAAADARQSAAEAAVRGARAAATPSLGLGAFFQVDPVHGDPGDAGPQVTWTVPLWRRNRAEVAAAEGAVDVATSAAARTTTSARVDARESRSGADDARALLERLPAEDVELEAVLDAIDHAYGSGEMDLLTVLQIRAQALSGARAALAARQVAAEAELSALLAEEDTALLAPSIRGEAR